VLIEGLRCEAPQGFRSAAEMRETNHPGGNV
jgi:hypothetical protein